MAKKVSSVQFLCSKLRVARLIPSPRERQGIVQNSFLKLGIAFMRQNGIHAVYRCPHEFLHLFLRDAACFVPGDSVAACVDDKHIREVTLLLTGPIPAWMLSMPVLRKQNAVIAFAKSDFFIGTFPEWDSNPRTPGDARSVPIDVFYFRQCKIERPVYIVSIAK